MPRHRSSRPTRAPPADDDKDRERQASYFVPSAPDRFTEFIRQGKANSILVGE
jgi:hypothetical protein